MRDMIKKSLVRESNLDPRKVRSHCSKHLSTTATSVTKVSSRRSATKKDLEEIERGVPERVDYSLLLRLRKMTQNLKIQKNRSYRMRRGSKRKQTQKLDARLLDELADMKNS